MGYLILGVILIPSLMGVSYYNQIKTYELKVNESFANIDIALSKRYEVVRQLFEIAKGYAKHEKETLMKLVELRNLSLSQKEASFQQIEKEYQRFYGLVESYPELKADQHFLKLQDAIVETEDQLAAARRLYNSNVTYYNHKIVSFPSGIVANMMSAKQHEFLQFKLDQIQNVNL